MKDSFVESHVRHRENRIAKTLQSLEKNNIRSCYVENAADACRKAISLIPKGAKVGYGGSLTLDQIGIKEILRKGDYNLLDRHLPGVTETEDIRLRKESLLSDVFLTSTNALTEQGQLVNIDGTGNRVAALIYGPAKVIVIAGFNKIVPDVETAVHRVKNYAAPSLARKRNRLLPCAKTGKCVNCHSDERFCYALAIIEHQKLKYMERITVIIVGEELGL